MFRNVPGCSMFLALSTPFFISIFCVLSCTARCDTSHIETLETLETLIGWVSDETRWDGEASVNLEQVFVLCIETFFNRKFSFYIFYFLAPN